MPLNPRFRQGAARHAVTRCCLLSISLVFISAQLQGQNGWTRKADMPTGRIGPTAAVVGGKIHVIGGQGSTGADLATNEVYDPSTNSWATSKPMPTAREFAFSGVVRDTIYVMGGAYANYAVTIAKVEAYDPVTNTWTSKADLSLPRIASNAAVVDGTIYQIGCSFNRSECQAYCPSSNSCQTRKSIPDSMGQRGGLSVTAYNGVVYTFGGSNYPPWSPLSQVCAYDPQSDTWTRRGNMPTSRFGMQTYLVEDKIYAIGGSQSENTALNTVEVYDPRTNTWKGLPDMPRRNVFFAGAVVKGKIYVLGGTPGWASASAEVWEYDPLFTDVADEGTCPEGFALLQNYPNPFNPTTVISYQVPVVSDVRLVAYDVLGREVKTLVDQRRTAGTHQVTFDGTNLSSGMYICRMCAGTHRQALKMVLAK